MRLYRILTTIAGIAFLIQGCSVQEKRTVSVAPDKIKPGTWRISMSLGEEILPFTLDIKKVNSSFSGEIINGKERLATLPFVLKEDSLYFRLPVFDSEFKARITDQENFSGAWYNYYRSENYSIPFTAKYGLSDRFDVANESKPLAFSGKWEVSFSPGTPDAYKAIGIFEQQEEKITGTFLTETGDYRFLDGNVSGNKLSLSCFDGSHAFLFHATLDDDQLEGIFYSGTHWKEPWIAKRNDDFELTHPDSITFLRKGFDNISFSYPNLEGESISYPSAKYDGKVTIIQVMGSWCPNCMDETVYLRDVYKQFHHRGLEIIALCFERSSNAEEAKKNIQNHRKHLGAEWEFLLAGLSGKDVASKALPMLNKIVSFPTTIFIDKKGEIRKIHTGFYGPGTGSYYYRFQEVNQGFIEKLLAE